LVVGFRGCPFGNAAVDYDDPAHSARVIARGYRELLRARLRLLSEALTGNAELGDQVAVLIDGATSTRHISARTVRPGPPWPWLVTW
jgi:hypothetical protein